MKERQYRRLKEEISTLRLRHRPFVLWAIYKMASLDYHIGTTGIEDRIRLNKMFCHCYFSIHYWKPYLSIEADGMITLASGGNGWGFAVKWDFFPHSCLEIRLYDRTKKKKQVQKKIIEWR